MPADLPDSPGAAAPAAPAPEQQTDPGRPEAAGEEVEPADSGRLQKKGHMLSIEYGKYKQKMKHG